MRQGRMVSRRTVAAGMAGGAALAAASWAPGRRSGAAQEALQTPVSGVLPATLPSGGTQPDGSWAFTDDLGNTAVRDATPTRIVAHVGLAAALYDFGFQVVGIYNPAVDEDGNRLLIAGNLPLDDLVTVGAWGEIDLEQLVELGMDLFVGLNYDVAEGSVWPLDESTLALVREIAPVVAIPFQDGADTRRTIETVRNLAAALGVDVEGGELAEHAAAFEAGIDDLAAAIAAKPGLLTMFMSADGDGFWVTYGLSDMALFQQLGLKILAAPDVRPTSWEQFSRWEADLIFNDDRTPNWWSVEQLSEVVPTFTAHPAVKAGQVAPWRTQYVPSYQGFTPILGEVTEWISNADDQVVD